MNSSEAEQLLIQRLSLGDTLAAPMFMSIHGDQLMALISAIAPGLNRDQQDAVLAMALEQGIATFDRTEVENTTLFAWFADQVDLQVRQWVRNHPGLKSGGIDSSENRSLGSDFDSAVVADLAAAVANLSDVDALVLALRNWQGLAYSIIAEIMGVKEIAARQKAKRALDRLEVAMGKSDQGSSAKRGRRSRQLDSTPLKTTLWVYGLEIFGRSAIQDIDALRGGGQTMPPQTRRQLIAAMKSALKAKARRSTQ